MSSWKSICIEDAMPSPFPGMDPSLEAPHLWPDVHNRLITLLANDLTPRLRPRYYVSIEERSYLLEIETGKLAGRADIAVVESGRSLSEPALTYTIAPPMDTTWSPALRSPVAVFLPTFEEMRETYLEVHAIEDDRVITVLEILSPSNKRPGKGRSLYLDKRLDVLSSATNLVEIDLLRAGEPMPVLGELPASDYRLLVYRHRQRPRADLYPFDIREPIPAFPVPLQRDEEEPIVDLGALVHGLYDLAGYDLRIDYRLEPDPALTGHDAVWASDLLQTAGLRQKAA